ncbi:MAG: OB-fold domain-containing protein [Acidimicrobiia bacterium]
MSELPAPVTDLDSEPFFAGLRRGVILVQECAACGRRRFGRLGACPYCGASGGTDVEIGGTGTVHSFVRVHRALTAEMADEVPYAIATVELDDGVRMLGRVEPPEAAEIGVRVGPRFVEHREWTELRFTVTA